MSDMVTLLHEAVADIARVAGDVALSHYRGSVRVEFKGDGSPVTIADRSAEESARTWIGARFPSDGIVGEEFGEVNSGAERCWIIDPIDGTKSFVHGVPLWGTLIAVCEGADVLAGAAYFPALGEMLTAAVGQGCWSNGVRTRVSEVSTLSDAMVLTTDEQFRARPDRRHCWEQLAAQAEIVRSWGDCYGYLLVATGRADVMVDPALSAWDAAALQRCVIEAGGVFTDWDGKPTAFGGSAIATNAAVARSARALLMGGDR